MPVQRRTIEPAPGEAPAEAWDWFTAADLRANEPELEPDVRELGLAAIEAVGN